MKKDFIITKDQLEHFSYTGTASEGRKCSLCGNCISAGDTIHQLYKGGTCALCARCYYKSKMEIYGRSNH